MNVLLSVDMRIVTFTSHVCLSVYACCFTFLYVWLITCLIVHLSCMHLAQELTVSTTLDEPEIEEIVEEYK